MGNLQQLGQFRLESNLGSNAYADLYRAYDTVRRRPVMLKVLKAGLQTGDLALSRFLGQAQLASELVHPHIAWVWETGQDGGLAFLVERFVSGVTLSEILGESGRLPWVSASRILQEISQALDFAHAKGLAHGDLKPESIQLSQEHGAVLADFGISLAFQLARQASPSLPPRSSPKYTAPELWQGEAPSPAADQYALACLLFEILTGQALFDAPTPAEARELHLKSISLLQARLLSAFGTSKEVLQRALAPDPANRYPSAGEFAGQFTEEYQSEADHHVIAWRETQKQNQLQAEEAARIAALEQARKDIYEQVAREIEKPPQPTVEAAPAPSVTLRPPDSPPKGKRLFPISTRFVVWGIGGALALIIAGLWLARSGIFNGGSASIPSPTVALAAPPTSSPTSPPTITPSQTLTATITATSTNSSTITITPSPTQTPTPSPTLKPSLTPTRTRTPRSTDIPEPPPKASMTIPPN